MKSPTQLMLNILRKKKGVISAEYVIVFFVVIAAVSSMTVYVRRGLQGRVRDSWAYTMVRAANAVNSTIPSQYEPYYLEAVSNIYQHSNKTERTVADGVYGDDSYLEKRTETTSVQAPPGAAN